MVNKIIWTIGHSTHTFEEFIHILHSFEIKLIADIRGLPGSNRYPQFNKESLEISLPGNNIQYVHIKDLGGRRKVKKDSHNLGWRKDSFRGYADYMETVEFKNGIDELKAVAMEKPTAMMCAEAVWWRCHRSMVSDYLKVDGWKVIHIMGAGKSQEHDYTQPARVIDGILSYPGQED